MKTINYFFVSLVFIFISFLGKSQVSEWEWATEISSEGGLMASSISNSDVTYVAGGFSGIQSFGSSVFDENNGNMYVCKVSNSNGNILSAHQLPYFFTNAIFTFTSDYQDDFIFAFETEGVLKLDSAGNTLWQFDLTSSSQAQPRVLTTDDSGNIYISGRYMDDIFYNNIQVFNGGGKGFFTLKLNPQGVFQWITTCATGGNGFTLVNDIAVDSLQNVIVTGDFTSSITAGNTTLTSYGGSDIFVMMLDVSGNVLWIKQAGGIQSSGPTDHGLGVAIDNSDGIYLTGAFTGVTQFSPMVGLVSIINEDIFIAKYNYNGDVLWATSAGVMGRGWSRDIVVNQDGESFITGFYQGTAFFGNDTLDNVIQNVTSNIFIAKCSATGDFIFADRAISYANQSSGVENNNSGKSIHLDGEDSCYVVGEYISMSDFGNISLGQIGSNIRHPFIAKYSQQSVVSTIEVLESKMELVISPNPNTGRFKILGLTDKFDISMFDVNGRKILSKRVLPNQEIQIDALLCGMYYLVISTENFTVTKRILKQ